MTIQDKPLIQGLVWGKDELGAICMFQETQLTEGSGCFSRPREEYVNSCGTVDTSLRTVRVSRLILSVRSVSYHHNISGSSFCSRINTISVEFPSLEQVRERQCGKAA